MKYRVRVEVAASRSDGGYQNYDTVYEQVKESDNGIVDSVIGAIMNYKPQQLVESLQNSAVAKQTQEAIKRGKQ